METPTVAEISAFVGDNADYYLRKWSRRLDRTGRWSGFNWGAFFLPWPWLAYRKMYLPAILAGLSISVYSRTEHMPGVIQDLSLLFGPMFQLFIMIACGTLGNDAYLSCTLKTIADVRGQSLGEETKLAELSKRGGTSVIACFALPIVCAVIFFLLARSSGFPY